MSKKACVDISTLSFEDLEVGGVIFYKEGNGVVRQAVIRILGKNGSNKENLKEAIWSEWYDESHCNKDLKYTFLEDLRNDIVAYVPPESSKIFDVDNSIHNEYVGVGVPVEVCVNGASKKVGVVVDTDHNICKVVVSGGEELFVEASAVKPITKVEKEWSLKAIKDTPLGRTVALFHTVSRNFRIRLLEEKENLSKKEAKLVDELSEVREKMQRIDSELNNPATITTDSYLQILNYSKYLLGKYEVFEKVIGEIIGHTYPITIQYKGHIAKMGSYSVAINVAERTIKILPCKDNTYVDEFIHPHIKSNGDACFGTYSEKIRMLFSNNSIHELFGLIHTFLSSANVGWYRSVHYWLENRDKICYTCFMPVNKCSCVSNNCIWCGEDLSKCKCLRCPVSGCIIGKRYDEYCIELCEYKSVRGCKC